MDRCPRCDSTRLVVKSKERRTVVDIPEPLPYTVREPVVHRKIRGQLKCEEGMTVFGRLMTAVSTWKLQGLNPLVEFKRYV